MQKFTDPFLPIRRWLTVCAFMIVCMVMIGGATRLTESGLSMTDWHPIHGVLPPLSAEEWQEEFTAYQQFPEYQKVNKGMTLSAFKTIFWWEYIHRIWGRLIGLVFALPLAWFAVRGRLPKTLRWPLVGLLFLGGMQGLVGWWMVRSGLVDRPDVSHYRLTMHLSLAFLLFAGCWWLALTAGNNKVVPLRWSKLIPAFFICYSATVIMGGFVAGLNAGLIYNEFPMMGQGIMPEELLAQQPVWSNWLSNPATIQFTHRWLAVSTVILAWLLSRKYGRGIAQRPAKILLAVAVLQLVLGIATLLYGVPVVLGVLHQTNAVLVLGSAIWLLACVRGYYKI